MVWKEIKEKYSVLLASDNDETLIRNCEGILPRTAKSFTNYLSSHDNNLLAILTGKPTDNLMGFYRASLGKYFYNNPEKKRQLFLSGSNGTTIWNYPNPMFPVGVEWNYFDINPAAMIPARRLKDMVSKFNEVLKMGMDVWLQRNDLIGPEQLPLVYTPFPFDQSEKGIDEIYNRVMNIDGIEGFKVIKHVDALDILVVIEAGPELGKGTALHGIKSIVDENDSHKDTRELPYVFVVDNEGNRKRYLLSVAFGDSGNDESMFGQSLINVGVCKPGKDTLHHSLEAEHSLVVGFEDVYRLIDTIDDLFEAHPLEQTQEGLVLRLPLGYNSFRAFQRRNLK